jgi:hypothetical protein
MIPGGEIKPKIKWLSLISAGLTNHRTLFVSAAEISDSHFIFGYISPPGLMLTDQKYSLWRYMLEAHGINLFTVL